MGRSHKTLLKISMTNLLRLFYQAYQAPKAMGYFVITDVKRTRLFKFKKV